jgi:putative FmdB family regulatory protein
MPIYAYKCTSCGYAKDVLQKVSDAPLTECPQCETGTFAKQLTAAGFQLRGSGWYATDFKNGSTKNNNNGAGDAKGPESGSKGSTSGASDSRASGSDSKGSTSGAGDSRASESGSKGSTSEGAAKTDSTSSSAGGSCGHGGCSACS